MHANLKNRLGRASVAMAVGAMALVGVASTADARDWRHHHWRPHHQWNGGAVSNGYYPYYHRSWDRGWTWGERYGAPPYAYGQRYYRSPPFGLMVR